MNFTENGYRKDNNCPYCGYFCDAATMPNDNKQKPTVGDLSFCLMCCEPSQFDKNMKLIKFDINSIHELEEIKRLTNVKKKMELFWVFYPDKSGRREVYLKSKDLDK